MRTTYHVEAVCENCGKKTWIIGYEKLPPSEVLADFLNKGGSCSNCGSLKFQLLPADFATKAAVNPFP